VTPRLALGAAAAALSLVACSKAPAPEPVAPAGPSSVGAPTRARVVRDTVTVRDPELERRLGRAELRVIEKEAQVAELQSRLDDARDEVVRTMAKLETLNSRAEAASGMAEADVAIQALRSAGGTQSPELAQANALIRRSNAEFEKRNFGGALYLANQARAFALAGRARLAGSARTPARAGETPFAVPVRLKVMGRGNVREGPATSFAVVFAVEGGIVLTGMSWTDEWIRVVDDAGRSGWIFRTLVGRP
jgi:hypothetical protein